MGLRVLGLRFLGLCRPVGEVLRAFGIEDLVLRVQTLGLNPKP